MHRLRRGGGNGKLGGDFAFAQKRNDCPSSNIIIEKMENEG